MAWFIYVEIETSSWVSSVPSPSVLPWKKYYRVFSRPNTKASVLSFCFILRFSPLKPTGRQLNDLSPHPGNWACFHSGCSGGRVHGAAGCLAAMDTWQWRENTGSHRVSALPYGQERGLLCSPGVITRSLGLGWTRYFFKRTSQLPKLSQAMHRSIPLLRLTGLYDQAPAPVPSSDPLSGSGGREEC